MAILCRYSGRFHSAIPALRRPTKYVSWSKARIFGTPKHPTPFNRAMLEITAVAAQPPRFCELEGGALDLAAKGIGGGKPGVNGRKFRIGAECLLEPHDRLVGTRLQQVHSADAEIPSGTESIMGTDAYGLFRERNRGC